MERGHWRNPMTDAEIEKQIPTAGCKRASGLPGSMHYFPEQLQEILEQMPDVGALIPMTQCHDAVSPRLRSRRHRDSRPIARCRRCWRCDRIAAGNVHANSARPSRPECPRH